ncbi:MAG: methyltransferase domain-containing protein [Methanosarcinales archaeon]|nr:methyltransferase domain-containing protein [Methanosarcinales archaeon]
MDYLSSGFSRVDSSEDPAVFLSCLQTLCSLPYFQSYKKKSLQLLNPGPGSRILEIGSGLGQDAASLARMVGRSGMVAAIDSSRKMIEAAGKGFKNAESIRCCLADACNLPLCDGAFDGARADRVLQHIPDPERAFSEMVRTVRDSGRLVVYEPDWGTFIISPGKKEICRTMTQLFGDTFPSGWIGRQLPGLFREEGLKNIRIRAETFHTGDLHLAIRVFDLVNNAHRAGQMGLVSPGQAEGRLDELRRAHERGRFFCSYTGFLVCGEKPGRQTPFPQE